MTRWEHPLQLTGAECDDLWSRPVSGPRLFIVGSGFDPRAAVSLERVVEASGGRVDGLLIELPEDATDPAVRPLALGNRERIESLIASAGGQLYVQGLPDYTDARSLGRIISIEFQRSGLLDSYSDVTLEVSAMPRSSFFPLARGILERAHLDAGHLKAWNGDFHIAVCEDSAVDRGILEEGTTPMAPLGGFAGPRDEGASTRIWVPVLGEGAVSRVERLYGELEPDETCPVVPWPSRDPRRGDDLVLEFRRLLFEDIRLEPRNIIYAAERNPFDLYRSIGTLWSRYVDALSPLGSVSMVLSSHSSKLLSLGVLLAAYDFGLQVQHVSPGTYGIRNGIDSLECDAEVHNLWLVGEPYVA